MKVYRTIDNQELEDIKLNNRIRFENPFWNFKSEGKIVNIFRKIDEVVCLKKFDENVKIKNLFYELLYYDKEGRIKNEIEEWVNFYLKSDTKIRSYLKRENGWYDIFTDLSLVIYIFFSNYCKCFSRLNKEIKIGKKENKAIIEINIDFNKNQILKCEDEKGRSYNLKEVSMGGKVYDLMEKKQNADIAYIRHYPVNYKVKSNYETIFGEFANRRCIIELLNIVSDKYEEQEEERVFINLHLKEILPNNVLSSLGSYFMNKYQTTDMKVIHINQNDECYKEDFIEAMYIQFFLIYIQIKEKFPRYMYIYFKDKIKVTEI